MATSNGTKTKSKRPKVVRGVKAKGIMRMLMRPSGATRAQLLDFTEKAGGARWTAISVPQQARATGLKLTFKKEKGKPMIYFGTPKGGKSKEAAA